MVDVHMRVVVSVLGERPRVVLALRLRTGRQLLITFPSHRLPAQHPTDSLSPPLLLPWTGRESLFRIYMPSITPQHHINSRSPPALPPPREPPPRSTSPPAHRTPQQAHHHIPVVDPQLEALDPRPRPDSRVSDSRFAPPPPPPGRPASASATAHEKLAPPASPPHKRFKLDNPLPPPPPFPGHVDQRWVRPVRHIDRITLLTCHHRSLFVSFLDCVPCL